MAMGVGTSVELTREEIVGQDSGPHLLITGGVHGDEFEPMAWHKRLTLQAEPADAPLLVTTDEVRVGQVIRNLVANALKYACEGTLLLRAFRVTEQEVRIQVVDNGRGIPLEQLSSLFAPSAKAPGPGPVPKGVGLGLTLSREIAALLGGDLRARTTEARGYEFTLVLHDYRCDLNHPDQKLAA